MNFFNGDILSESIGDKTFVLLKKLIIQGKLTPGERIKEENLSNLLNVSRTPLREAIKRLEVEGWVKKIPREGLHVSNITLREAKEFYDIREVLEGLMVRQATENINEKELNKLEDLIDKMEKAAELKDSQLVINYGQKFNALIYEISNNQKSKEILNNVIEHIERYRYISVEATPDRGVKAGIEHRKILHMIKSKDPFVAEQAMKEHIRQGNQSVISSIRRYIKESEGSEK